MPGDNTNPILGEGILQVLQTHECLLNSEIAKGFSNNLLVNLAGVCAVLMRKTA